jgi:hypothetical protein
VIPLTDSRAKALSVEECAIPIGTASILFQFEMLIELTPLIDTSQAERLTQALLGPVAH